MSVPEGYERSKNRERNAVAERMRQLPAVVDAIARRTPVALTCPRGHKIVTVELVDDDGYLEVRPLAPFGRAGGSVAVNDSPWTKNHHVCSTPGCPTLIERDGWCEKHGGRDAVAIHPIATRFTCGVKHDRRAPAVWSDRVTTARLMKAITAALVIGHGSVSVTGSTSGAPHR
ncbi:MAG: hypothetical protein ACYC1Z_04710 [Georgenia sp.]